MTPLSDYSCEASARVAEAAFVVSVEESQLAAWDRSVQWLAEACEVDRIFAEFRSTVVEMAFQAACPLEQFRFIAPHVHPRGRAMKRTRYCEYVVTVLLG